MKAIGYLETGPINRPNALMDFDLPRPEPTGQDLLVRIEAVSVNPVDTKVRQRREPQAGKPEILGWDAVGEVVATGDNVREYAPGDRVWYAGVVDRPGSNAEYQLVDERIVGRAPRSLPAASAAALPLTTLTAHEMLFDRLRVTDPVPGAAPAVLIIGGAGGVGSIAIQLLRSLTDLTVIATASRPETQDWVRQLGAHHVISHAAPLAPQVATLGLGQPGFVFSTTHSHLYVEECAALMAPQGRYGLIDDPENLSIMPFKTKAISVHWEMMFTRPMFKTPDITRQRDILNGLSQMIDEGKVTSTATQSLGRINAETLMKAHALIESNQAKGKIVLEGF